MTFPAPALLLSAAALFAAATAPVSTPPALASEAEAPVARSAAAATAPASDYTTQMLEPPLVREYDPATAPPPTPLAEAPDEDGLRHCVGPDGVPIFTD